MAPDPIWHRTQFGTKSVVGSIWHQECKRVNLAPDPIWHQECERSQFGTGVNLAPESIWHRTQFGTKGVKGSIWHRLVVLCLGTLTSPMRVENFFQWTLISNIRGLFGFVSRRRVKNINTGLFLPTFEEGLFVLCLGALTGPIEGINTLQYRTVIANNTREGENRI